MVTAIAKRVAISESENVMDYDIKGLSTDTKPTTIKGAPIGVNSLFFEVDTGDFYFFNGTTWVATGA